MGSVIGRIAAFVLAGTLGAASVAAPVRLDVHPSDTDRGIEHADSPHVVFREGADSHAPLLVFLPGTGGETLRAVTTERVFLADALAQGYRFIILSYIDSPAVAQVCRPSNADRDCANRFREERAFGDGSNPPIGDAPQDAIVHRLSALLRYLSTKDPDGHWEAYLEGDQPSWSRIVLSGQSQGGGMAAFIAKRIAVHGVIDFSGGWDMESDAKVASWYAAPSATPPDRYFGTYHVKEKFAKVIAASYQAMQFPPEQQFALDKPVSHPDDENPGHGDGASNPVYEAIWLTMLKRLNP